MPSLVVTAQGAMVRHTGGQIVVELEGRTIQRMPEEQIERALFLGGVGMTPAFLGFALGRRLPVAFLSQDGSYKGRLDPGGVRDVRLNMAQLRRMEDLPWRLETSSRIVRAKISGCATEESP